MRIERVSQGEDAQSALRRLERTGGVLELHGLVRAPSQLRYESTYPLSIVGYGPGLSGVIFTGTTGGLDVAVEDEFEAGAMQFSGFGCYATGFYDDAGFRLASHNNRGGPRAASTIRDVVCATVPGRHRRGGSFGLGFHLHDMPHVRMDHCFAYGPGGYGAALYLSGDCTPGPVGTDVQGYYWRYGITKPADGKTEGTRLHSSQLVNNDYGIWWENDGGEPGLQIDGGHISSTYGNVVIKRAHQAGVRHIVLYRRHDSEGDFYDIDAEDIMTLTVAGNQAAIRGPGDSAMICTRNVREFTEYGNNVQGGARDRVVA